MPSPSWPCRPARQKRLVSAPKRQPRSNRTGSNHTFYMRAQCCSAVMRTGRSTIRPELVGDDPDPDPEARLELAIMLLSAGRDDDALSQVNQILLEQPARTDALRLMAIINFRLDHLDAARDDFQDLLEHRPLYDGCTLLPGPNRGPESDLKQALRYYSQVTRGSNAIISQRRAAGIIALNGNEEAALEHLSEFAEINPNYAVDMLQSKAQLLSSWKDTRRRSNTTTRSLPIVRTAKARTLVRPNFCCVWIASMMPLIFTGKLQSGGRIAP